MIAAVGSPGSAWPPPDGTRLGSAPGGQVFEALQALGSGEIQEFGFRRRVLPGRFGDLLGLGPRKSPLLESVFGPGQVLERLGGLRRRDGLAERGLRKLGQPLFRACASGLGPGRGPGGPLEEEQLYGLSLALEFETPLEDASRVLARIALRLTAGEETSHLAYGRLER